MTGGGIERALRITSAALTGRPSRRSATPGATGCPRGGHRLSHEPGRTRCLATLPPPERYKGRHSPSIDRLRWAENRSLRSVFTLLRIEGRPVSAAVETVPAAPCGALCKLRSIAPIWPLRLSPPLACQDASGDEPVDASLQQAGRGYRRSGAAQARLREATDGPVWPSHPPLTTAPALQRSPWLAAATRSHT